MNSSLPGVATTREERVDRLVKQYCEALDTLLHSLMEDDRPGFSRSIRLDAAREAIEATGKKLASLVGEPWVSWVPPEVPRRTDPPPPELVLSPRGRKLPRWMQSWFTSE